MKDKFDDYGESKLYDKTRKRKSDETENNLKIDLMKVKSKNEELERNLTDRTRTIKDLKDQIVDFERKKLEKQYVDE